MSYKINYEHISLIIMGGAVFISIIYLINKLLLKSAYVMHSMPSKNEFKASLKEEESIFPEKQNSFPLGETSGSSFTLEYNDFKKFCLILGTTGSGKTVTIKNIFSAFIEQGYPIIYVDGKPSDSLIPFLAEKAGARFKGFNCHDYSSYNFLKGSASEIKDRIICIKDHWESDYYKTVSSDYIQTVLRYLTDQGREFTLSDVLELMNISKFLTVLKNSKSPLIDNAIHFADSIKANDLKGLYSHISLIINSDFGPYLTSYDSDTIVLEDVINNNGVAYFALPALKFPEFSAFIGKVVINDIKSTIERIKKPVLLIFDEFSVFAGGQVLNLINQGREFGAHTIVGTQSLEDLKEWSDQILNNANLLISHRVHSNNTAESISKFFGTRRNIQVTRQLGDEGVREVGSARATREFFVHPDDLKTLKVGECYVNIKDTSLIKKIKINYL